MSNDIFPKIIALVIFVAIIVFAIDLTSDISNINTERVEFCQEKGYDGANKATGWMTGHYCYKELENGVIEKAVIETIKGKHYIVESD